MKEIIMLSTFRKFRRPHHVKFCPNWLQDENHTKNLFWLSSPVISDFCHQGSGLSWTSPVQGPLLLHPVNEHYFYDYPMNRDKKSQIPFHGYFLPPLLPHKMVTTKPAFQNSHSTTSAFLLFDIRSQ